MQKNNGVPVWQQPVNQTTYLTPWYINYLGGDWLNATQCMAAGSNSWQENQLALDHGLNDHWAISNTPWSWGHFKRSDIPVQFGIADGWTVGDMYQVSLSNLYLPLRKVKSLPWHVLLIYVGIRNRIYESQPCDLGFW